jgi:hypothetical protein
MDPRSPDGPGSELVDQQMAELNYYQGSISEAER